MKRRLVIIAVFLLAGATVNVAVAWGCATRSEIREYSTAEALLSPPYVELGEIRADQALSGFGVRVDLVHSHALGYYIDVAVSAGWPFPAIRQSDWMRCNVAREPADPQLVDEVFDFIQSLPTGRDPDPALASYFGSSAARQEAIGFIVLLESCVQQAVGQAQATPRRTTLTKPIWFGFTANSMLFAAVLYALFSGPFALRRLMRLRRGLCPKCAYPMGTTDTCTECGAELPKRARAMT